MLEIFQYDFMLRAFGAGIIIAIVAPMIGIFLVMRRFSLMADTLAHISLAGIAIGILTGINPILASVVVAIASAIGIEKIRQNKKVFSESVLSLFLSGGLALATILISLGRGFNTDLFSYLFGSISTVTINDLGIIAALAVIVLILVSIFYKELFFVSLNEELAKASGVRVKFINFIIILMACLTVVLSMRIIGILLIGALIVIPVMTATQFAKSFKQTIFYSIAISLFDVLSGLFISYYYDLASGGTIVMVAIVSFLFSLLFFRKR